MEKQKHPDNATQLTPPDWAEELAAAIWQFWATCGQLEWNPHNIATIIRKFNDNL